MEKNYVAGDFLSIDQAMDRREFQVQIELKTATAPDDGRQIRRLLHSFDVAIQPQRLEAGSQLGQRWLFERVIPRY